MNQSSLLVHSQNKKILLYFDYAHFCFHQINLASRQKKDAFIATEFCSFLQLLNQLLDIYIAQTGDEWILITTSQSKKLAKKIIEQQFADQIQWTVSTKTQPNRISDIDLLAARNLKQRYQLKQFSYQSKTLELESLIDQFNRELKNNHYLDEIALIDFLIEKFSFNSLSDSFAQIELIDKPPDPLTKKLIDHLKIKIIDQAKKPKKQFLNHQLNCYQADYAIDEVQFCFTQLFKYQKQNPHHKIICAVANFNQYQMLLSRYASLKQNQISLLAFKENLSDKKVFSDLCHLLELLFLSECNKDNLLQSFATASFGHHLCTASSKFLNELKQLATDSIDRVDFLSSLKNYDITFFNHLNENLKPIIENKKQSYENWASLVSKILLDFKWQIAQSNPISYSENWQVLNQILDQILSLSLVETNPISQSEFFNTFIELISQKSTYAPFHLRSIIVLPIEQLPNINHNDYDATWLMGMNENFPKIESISPYFLTQEQKNKNPNCNELIIFNRYSELIKNLINDKKLIALSYLAFEDQSTLQISPILDQIATKTGLSILSIDHQAYFLDHLAVNVDCDQFIADNLENKTDLDKFNQVSVSQLNRFKLCNFLSFAEKYLHPSDEQVSIYPDSLHKGKLIHLMLENFFQLIPNDIALKKLDAQSLEKIRTKIIKQCLNHLDDYSSFWQQSETLYLNNLWINFVNYLADKSFQVLALELPVAFNFKGLNIKGRIDRVEATQTDNTTIKYALIDTKSSNRNWHNDSIQLDLYQWILAQKSDHPFYAKNHQINYQLMLYDEKPKDMPRLLDDKNHHNIEQFLTYFQSGTLKIAAIDFCDRCDYRSLCRIDESTDT